MFLVTDNATRLLISKRCQLRDREVNCREKDCEIRDLKEKIVNLVRQLEMQKAELSRQEKLMVSPLFFYTSLSRHMKKILLYQENELIHIFLVCVPS